MHSSKEYEKLVLNLLQTNIVPIYICQEYHAGSFTIFLFAYW